MNFFDLFIASLAGTSAMTLFMYILSFITGYKTKVINVLGTLLTFQAGPNGELSTSPLAVSIGSIAHYAIGFAFTLVYGWIWWKELLQPDWWSILILGTISGILAIGFWGTVLKIHPRPPRVKLSAYLIAIFFAHYVFVWGVVLGFKFL